jgi:uncharacterized membrane protein YccC
VSAEHPPSPLEAVAQQMDRLQAQARANLAEAQHMLEREQQRLVELLDNAPPPPPTQRFDLAGGLDTIRRTLESTSDYLAKHLTNPQLKPAAVPSSITSTCEAPLP